MPSLREELRRDELEAAERGFEQLLRRKHFSPAFLDRHAADLLAKARLEYSQYVAGGGEVRNPVGWIIHCAWRRTQNLLEQEGRAPRVISIDNGTTFANESATPEEEILTSDRYRQLQTALEQLPPEERQVIALAYFEGMSVREAGRTLKWDKCKTDRRHHAALKRLHTLLGVEDAEALQLEIGIAAWASLAAGHRAGLSLPSGSEATVETASRGLGKLIGRAQDLAHRLLAGGATEPGTAAALSGAGRAAGVCGAAAAACLATGFLGPGVGAIDVIGDRQPEKPAIERPTARAMPVADEAGLVEIAPAPAPSPARGNDAGEKRPKSRKPPIQRSNSQREVSAPTTAPTSTARRFEDEFGTTFGGSSESSAPPAPARSGGSISSRSTGSQSAPPPPASTKQVETEFGL